MKNFKAALGWMGLAAAVLFCGWLGSAHSSGVGGNPFNPIFGAVTATSESLTGASTSASYSATGNVSAGTATVNASSSYPLQVTGTNGLIAKFTGSSTASASIQCGTICNFVSTGAANVIAASGSCAGLSSDVTGAVMLPCSGASGAANYIFTAKAAQTTVSGQMYAFMLVTNGTTCVVASSSPGLPSGWSAASSGTGVCTITFPAVTSANKMIAVVTAGNSGDACSINFGSQTTTTVKVACFVTSSAAAVNDTFNIVLQDWD